MVGQFGEFLDADAGVPQRFHGSPGPKRAVFLAAQVAALPAAAGMLGPDPGGFGAGRTAAQFAVCCGERLPGSSVVGGLQAGGGVEAGAVHVPHQQRQDRQPFAGALVHA